MIDKPLIDDYKQRNQKAIKGTNKGNRRPLKKKTKELEDHKKNEQRGKVGTTSLLLSEAPERWPY